MPRLDPLAISAASELGAMIDKCHAEHARLSLALRPTDIARIRAEAAGFAVTLPTMGFTKVEGTSELKKALDAAINPPAMWK